MPDEAPVTRTVVPGRAAGRLMRRSMPPRPAARNAESRTGRLGARPLEPAARELDGCSMALARARPMPRTDGLAAVGDPQRGHRAGLTDRLRDHGAAAAHGRP